MEAARDPDTGKRSAGRPGSRALHPAQPEGDPGIALKASGSGRGSDDAGRIVDALKASAEQELTIAERVSGKARQAFALAAGLFVVAQTVVFGRFEAENLTNLEKDWMIGLAIGAVVLLVGAAFATIKADATVDSRDLPLGKLEDDLEAAYDGDPEVTGRLGMYYLGVVRTRRESNETRRTWYKVARVVVGLSLAATVAELIASLVYRAS